MYFIVVTIIKRKQFLFFFTFDENSKLYDSLLNLHVYKSYAYMCVFLMSV